MSQEEKTKPTCPYCGSDEVVCDANAAWNEETQQWEVASVYDSGACQDCEAQTKRFNWTLVSPV